MESERRFVSETTQREMVPVFERSQVHLVEAQHQTGKVVLCFWLANFTFLM